MDRLTIEEFGRRLRARQLSSLEIVDECLRRIEADNGRLNAFILIMADEARRQAREADLELAAGIDRGPLHGLPMSVKDLFDVAGTVTTAASRVRESIVATASAPAIARLRDAGAVIVGKTNLHEFALGTTNEESAFGPARHPMDNSRSPGGSSGGSAISVAAGMALATLGTDTGGSIRIPAAACGLVGLKPTFGELSTAGVVPLSTTFDHIGPLTHTVADAWHVLHALRGRSPAKPLSARAASQMQLGVPRRYFCDLLEESVRTSFEASLDALRRAGAQIVDADIPHAPLTPAVYLAVALGDAAAYHAHTLETVPERYTPNVRLRLEAGRYVLAEDYVRALDGRRLLRNEVDRAMIGNDALVLPTLPILAPPIGAPMVDIGASSQPVRTMMLRLTQLFNITGHPALTLPCTTSSAGLPRGLQLVGAFGQTDTLLHLARGVEEVVAPAFCS
jgi:aspartyl-tRNA(Asn)/glutamyl-tRNA(Gln) amidotransferase subunit A